MKWSAFTDIKAKITTIIVEGMTMTNSGPCRITRSSSLPADASDKVLRGTLHRLYVEIKNQL